MDVALHRYLVEEIGYDHAAGLLGRREALHRLALLGLGTVAGPTLLVACGASDDDPADADANGAAPTPSSGTSTSTTAPVSGTGAAVAITFAGPRGTLQGAWAAPTGAPRGGVLVIHENRGLTDHIRSLPTRFATDGYAALAIDLLSEEGGTAAVGDAGAIAALGAAPEARIVADLRAGLDELTRRVPGTKLAVIGFCFGGGLTWQLLAAGEPRLAAAAPFYGPAPSPATFTGSRAAVLAVYAERDTRVNATRDAAVAGLEAARLPYRVLTLPGVDHAFFNDTGARYDATAAATAYRAVLDWFGTHLS